MTKATPLLFADSDHNSDMLYFTGFKVPDPFIAMEIHGKRIGVLNALEFGRARKESSLDEVLSLEEYQEKARKRWPDTAPGTAEVIAVLAAERKQKSFTIADDFPAGLASRLHLRGLQLSFAKAALFPAREFKSAKETAAIREGNRCAALGIAAAEKLLKASRIKDGYLLLKGEKLTSEKLKFAIEVACLEAGALSLNTIAAGGDQACDPHCSGSGPLRANELIIVDVFPRVTQTGFHGDMTRTFLRGKASEAQASLVEAVRVAQGQAIKKVRDGVNGRDIHRGVVAEFEKRGYLTKRSTEGSEGFFHGTGHGLGLAVHELPRISGALDYTLRKGAVVTVEPGLYYPGLGACRIEDVVQVTGGAAKLLSEYHYNWELR
jgi:Xaa-Pro aminopeptidase